MATTKVRKSQTSEKEKTPKEKSSKKEKTLPESLEGIERDSILRALHQPQGVQTKAADSLGISERVLRYKMKKYRIRSNPPSPPFTKGGDFGTSGD